MPRLSAEIRQRDARVKKAEIPLDTVREKRRPGRRAQLRPSDIAGRAANNRWILNQVWDRLWPLLSKAQTEEAVVKAFQEGGSPYDRGFMPFLAGLVIKVMNEPKFPRRREARINFLADSLAGVGCVTPRRSRDICEQERAKAKRTHHIICYEFYVECSCGHKGRSRNHACPKWRKNLFWIWFDIQFCHGVNRSPLFVTYVRYVGGLRTVRTQFGSGQLRIEKQAEVNLGLNGSCRKCTEQIRHTLACNPK